MAWEARLGLKLADRIPHEDTFLWAKWPGKPVWD